MIKEIKMYTVICDKCKHDIGDDNEYYSFNKEQAKDDSLGNGWVIICGNNYCNECIRVEGSPSLINTQEVARLMIKHRRNEKAKRIFNEVIDYSLRLLFVAILWYLLNNSLKDIFNILKSWAE